MGDKVPNDSDILLGRGPDCWNHQGNKQFRITIGNYQELYHSISKRAEKVELVAKIVDSIQSSGARFLKRNNDSDEWKEVERKTCIEKVGHAIRDKQLSKCRKGQKSHDTSNLSSVARPIQIWVEEKEPALGENYCFQSILEKVQHQGDDLKELMNSSICNGEAQSQRIKPLNKLTPFDLSSTGLQTMSSYEMNDVRIQNLWRQQYYQPSSIGDSMHSRFENEMTIKLLRHSRLESLRAMRQQQETMDTIRLSIMNPISQPNWFPNSLLLQSKRKEESMLAYLGYLNSMSPRLPPC